jgi:thioredoxin reductase (NADPH)
MQVFSMQCDVLIIGCGAAGLQAAIHAARKKVKVILVGKAEGSALTKAHIENYFGTHSIEGKQMLTIGMDQARKYGAELIEEEAIDVKSVESGFLVKTDGMNDITTKALILAMGISRTKLNVEGEKEFHGLGVSYCANCDCHFFKRKKVAVVGDGSSAAMAALLLKDYAEKVYWILQEPKASAALMEKMKGTDIQIIPGTVPVKIIGEQTVKAIELTDGRKIEIDGVFIELGAKSAADLAVELGILADENGSIPVDGGCKTEVDGVYACGDITGQPWQLARAVGQGCIAGLNAASFVRKEKE